MCSKDNYPQEYFLERKNNFELWKCKFTDNWVDDYPGTAEGKDAHSDQDLQEPLPEGGKISRIGDVDIPSTDFCLKSRSIDKRIKPCKYHPSVYTRNNWEKGWEGGKPNCFKKMLVSFKTYDIILSRFYQFPHNLRTFLGSGSERRFFSPKSKKFGIMTAPRMTSAAKTFTNITLMKFSFLPIESSLIRIVRDKASPP